MRAHSYMCMATDRYCTCGGQRTSCRGQFPPPAIVVPRMQLGDFLFSNLNFNFLI